MTSFTTNINDAIEELKRGEVVAIPTETVYGLAADASNEEAIKKIFSIKKRPLNHPLIMHVCHDWDLSQWVSTIPEYARQMIIAFWPGPLTLVLNSKASVLPSLVNGGQNSLAIRAPKHDLTQEILRKLNRPLVAPSANPFGQVSPTTAKHVAESFPNENFLILDGGRCSVGIESTIIRATEPEGYSILRPGMVDLETITARFGNPLISNQSAVRVSGQLDSHYQPKKKLYYLHDWQQLDNYLPLLTGKIFTISISQQPSPEKKLHFQLADNEQRVAYELYDVLRYADQSEANTIVIELPANQAKWQAIREKIMKAGSSIDTLRYN